MEGVWFRRLDEDAQERLHLAHLLQEYDEELCVVVWTALALDRFQEQQMQWYALFKTRYEDLLRQSSAGPDDGPNPSL